MGSFWSVCFRSEEALRVIEQVCRNDPDCFIVEIKPKHHLRKSDFVRLFDGLRRNTHVTQLMLVGLGLNDNEGLLLASALLMCPIVYLNLDHNNFSGQVISQIIRAITQRDTVKHLCIRGQRDWDYNSKALDEIKKTLQENNTLRFIGLEIPTQDLDSLD